ncbi:hypothetical protein NMG60_11002903 [Bertholletia excelsa]
MAKFEATFIFLRFHSIISPIQILLHLKPDLLCISLSLCFLFFFFFFLFFLFFYCLGSKSEPTENPIPERSLQLLWLLEVHRGFLSANMASSEGIFKDEQQEMLRIVTQNAEILPSSPKTQTLKSLGFCSLNIIKKLQLVGERLQSRLM